LDQIRNVDVLAHVVRCFEDPDVVHVEPTLDPVRDMEVLETELILADLQSLEKRLEKVRRAAKSHDKAVLQELSLLERLEKALDQGRRASSVLEEHEESLGLDLLTAKPFFYVANVGEEDLQEPGSLLSSLIRRVREERGELVILCGKVEAELVDLPEEERAEYLLVYGLERSGLEQLIEVGYRLLKLVTFYTVVGKELRAWTVPRGTSAVRAAGKIHSDMERGFIRAEVLSFEDFRRWGSMTKARDEGCIRSEGRDYRIEDGDIITFRFRS
jgi:hypothetical protein